MKKIALKASGMEANIICTAVFEEGTTSIPSYCVSGGHIENFGQLWGESGKSVVPLINEHLLECIWSYTWTHELTTCELPDALLHVRCWWDVLVCKCGYVGFVLIQAFT